MKKYMFCSLIALLFTSGLLMSAEKSFVSQPSELSAEIINNMPTDLVWEIINKLEPSEALQTIERLKLVSKRFRDIMKSPRFVHLEKIKRLERLEKIKRISKIPNKYKTIFSLAIQGDAKNREFVFNKETQKLLVEENILPKWSVKRAYELPYNLLFAAIASAKMIPKYFESFKFVVDNATPEQLEIRTGPKNLTPLELAIDWALIYSQTKNYKKASLEGYNRSLKIIEYLLHKGVNPSITGLKEYWLGLTPEIAELIKKHGGDPEEIKETK